MTIKQVQCLLTYMGYDTSVDGVFGSETSSQIRKFQNDYGCDPVDGYPGKITDAALLEAVTSGFVKRESASTKEDEQTVQASSQDRTSTVTQDTGYPYFSLSEFRCHCSDPNCVGKSMKPSDALLRKLVDIRVRFGSPVTISSGIRCPAHNSAVGGVSNSYHLTGRAADINVRGISTSQLMAYCSGLQLHYYYDIDGSFVHIDI